jgi:glycosyltransferase involved in cell wall biosynthesis
MGAGRAVVSTPYAYASELLDAGRGVLVPPGSPTAWADALISLLENDGLRDAIARRAYEHSREMVWSTVGARYRQLFSRVVTRTRTRPSPPSLVAVHG